MRVVKFNNTPEVWGKVLIVALVVFGIVYVMWAFDSHRYEKELLHEYTYDGMEVPEYAR